MLKIAMISKWHVHAEGYAQTIQSFDNAKITCVWDEIPDRGKEWAKKLNVDFEPDLDTLLRREDVDGVVVDAPTAMHAHVMIAAAKAGKHIFTEKAMALTVKDCKKIAEAVQETGVKFCISFPARTNPINLYAKKVIDDGLLGEITLLRIRNGHDGALNNWLPDYWYDEKMAGGGAMMDLGCHPMYLASWFLGEPKRITSMFNYFTNREVEDNAQCSIEFENKGVALVETSLVTFNSPSMLEIYGTEGTLIACGDDVKIISKKMNQDFKGWLRPTKLPAAKSLPLKQWVDAIQLGTPIEYGLEEGIRLTEMLEAAYIAHKEKRTVELV
jgi:1,5-anhydro-D-fructose reductase (1,5-anhydro-D-mannitol-forming)